MLVVLYSFNLDGIGFIMWEYVYRVLSRVYPIEKGILAFCGIELYESL